MRPTDRHRERGTQLLELAIVLPLLALLVLMVTEGADFVRAHNVINNAAREGARLSALKENEGANAQIQAAVQQYVTNEGATQKVHLNGGNASVTVNQAASFTYNNGSTTVTATASQVTVTFPYTFSYLPNFTGGPMTVTLSATAEFRNLY